MAGIFGAAGILAAGAGAAWVKGDNSLATVNGEATLDVSGRVSDITFAKANSNGLPTIQEGGRTYYKGTYKDEPVYIDTQSGDVYGGLEGNELLFTLDEKGMTRLSNLQQGVIDMFKRFKNADANPDGNITKYSYMARTSKGIIGGINE
ncbi:MAG: hypothetical protein PHH14_05620 [Candidatus Margulisbacteria bacterium]|nr:hypothetical protein [Candidatus Margulisiibacteriota bacterium]